MESLQPHHIDPDYALANALYHQSRRNRSRGCNSDTLRRLLASKPNDYASSTAALLSRGWIMESPNHVVLTSKGWESVLFQRLHKNHAAVRFLNAVEQRAGVGLHAYRFDYLLRDTIARQRTHSITVSITDELCRRWQTTQMDQAVDQSGLVRLLRRLALDHVTARLETYSLADHESVYVSGLVGNADCRYNLSDLPMTDNDEYEIEWLDERR
jgi:hypothetical protein